MEYLLILDDGHGPETAGKRSPEMADGSVMRENTFNKAVKQYAKAEAERNGIHVFLTAPEDTDVPLATRSKRANDKYREFEKKYGKDGFKCILIAIHANAFKGVFGSHGGIDTFYHINSARGKAIATIIQKHLVKGSPLRDRGIKPENFHIIRETIMGAVLVELGFMDSEHDIQYLISDDYRRECARELVEGTCEYFGIPYKASAPVNTNEYIGHGVVTTAVLNVRPSASTTLPRIGTLKKDTTVKLLSKVGAWYRIEFGGREGFVHGDYINFNQPKPVEVPKPVEPTKPTAPTEDPTKINWFVRIGAYNQYEYAVAQRDRAVSLGLNAYIVKAE